MQAKNAPITNGELPGTLFSSTGAGAGAGTGSVGDIPTKESLQLELQKLEKTLQTAGSSGQLVKLLAHIESRQQQIDQTLHQFTSRRSVNHGSTTRSLEITRVELSSTLNHSRALKKIVQEAASLSSRITQKVRLLDSEKSSIKTTKEYVENVRTLKYEIQRAHDTIERQDWLAAASAIKTVRELPSGLISDEFVEFIVPTSDLPERPEALVQSWISELSSIFVKEFNTAAANKDVQRLTYFFQLFPLIGKSETGLECYSRFICNIISEQSRTILRSIQGKNDLRSDFYAQVLFQLYQMIADIVHQHSRIISRYYGVKVITSILTAIQTECDLQSGLIFDTFWDSKRLDKAISEVSRYDYPILVGSIYNRTQNNDDELVDDDNIIPLAEVSNLIDELSTMLNHWAMYCKFFVVTWNDAVATEDKTSAVYPRPLLTSTFMDKIRVRVTRNFDQLCTFAIRRTLEKAFLLENLPELTSQLSLCVKYLTIFSRSANSVNQSLVSLIPDDPPVTSMIEDITMSLNLIMLQTVNTGEFFTIKNMISNTRRILENDFLNILKKKLSDYQPKQNAVLLTPAIIQFLQSPHNRNFYSGSQNGSSSNLMTPRSGTPPIGSRDVSNSNMNSGSLFMKSATSAINAAMNLSGTESESSDKLSHFIITLNSISMFQEYLSKLSRNLIEKLEKDNLLIIDNQEFNQVLASLEKDPHTQIELKVNLVSSEASDDTPSVRDRIKSVIGTLSSTFNEKSTLVLGENIRLMFNQVFRSKITKMINDAFKEGDYLISSDSFSLTSSSDSTVQFIKEWNFMIVPYLTTMTRANFSTLLRLIVSNIASSLETRIWSLERKCNELGATKLERDVSTVVSEITKFDYSLRDRFIRVTQIVMMLGLDDDEEIEDLDDFEWALTPGERNRARNLRFDRK